MSMEPAVRNVAGSRPLTSRRWERFYPAAGFVVLCLAPAVSVWGLVHSFLAMVFRNDTFAYIPLIPVASFYLVYVERKSIFATISYGWRTGSALVVPGAACLAMAQLKSWQWRPENQISLLMLGFVLLWAGAFALFFGDRAFHSALFPLLFLGFAIPVPEPALSQAVSVLQHSSATAAESLFRLFGVAFLRRDLDFMLPGVTIRVAEECSGIRSTLALLITTALASYLFLRDPWRRLLLCLVVVPIAIVKNGLRIVILSTLAVYVDPRFLTGNLHHRGGVVFFILGLLPLALLLFLLQKGEKRSSAVAGRA